ncbi:prominin-1-like [Gastrophryne carolinensis]
MSYQNLTNPTYSPSAAPETGAMKVFSDMVHSYLDLVQRNSFPPAFLEQYLKTLKSNVFSDNVREILMYEVGYLVALAIGVLFIVLMTLVGLFFACCRCCGNCGGKMYQKQTKNMNCKRRFLYIFLFIITLVILAGDICAFYSNSKIDNAINNSFNSFDNSVTNLKTYINTVPKDVDIIINASDLPISQANSSITGIGPVLGGSIKRSIETQANKTLNDVQDMLTLLNNTMNTLVAINNTFNNLKEQQDRLVKNLTDVQNQINSTVTNCGASCSGSLPLNDLVIDANFDSIPSFSDQLQTINDFLNSSIESTIQDARKTLNDIPQTVTNETKKTVQDVQKQLGNIKTKILDVKKSINIMDQLDSFNSYLDTAANYSHQYKPDVIKYEYYRWIVGICLPCIILLVVVCNLLGLLFAPCGHKAYKDPAERNCASNCGGLFFMAGAGFSFIFAWLLMLITAILFAVGGNVYTSFCKPWRNQQLYQLVDNNLNVSQKVNLSGINLSIQKIYRDCQKDASLWNTLNLSSQYNLDSYLNITPYTSDVTSTLDNTNITINNITFMNDDQKNKVTKVSNSGVDTLDFHNFTQQANKNIIKTNLTSFADQLSNMAKSAPSPYNNELNNEAQTLLNIQSTINADLLPLVGSINASIANLKSLSNSLPANLNRTLASIQAAQTFLDTQVVGLVRNETRAYLYTILGYFESYINWTKDMLTNNLARCAPVAGALDSAEVVTCEYLVDTFNAFWFSIGWCTIFFIPSIILAVKLAKHYRRMKSSDIYETTNSQQFLIPRVTAKS